MTAQALASASPCFACIPKGYRDAVLIYLLATLAGVTDVATLVSNARCYDCIPKGFRDAVIIYLQDAINTSGGGGGGATEVFSLLGGASPGVVPTGSGVAYNENGQLWVWNQFAGTWEQLIA